MNRVVLQGHLGKKPELRETPAGKKVTNLSVASTERDRTSWFDVTVWGVNAENCCKYLNKGSNILISGRMVQDIYEKDGEKRYSLKLNADTVKFLDKKKDEQWSAQDNALTESTSFMKEEFDGIPF